MVNIHAVLLVPAEGDPLGLLAEGPCGARPPTARWQAASVMVHSESWDDTTCPVARCGGCGEVWPCDTALTVGPDTEEVLAEARWRAGWARISSTRRALVLAWEGKPVWQGMAQAHSVSMRDVTGSQSWPSFVGVVHVVRWAEVYAAEGLGTLVLLDAEGKEVTP